MRYCKLTTICAKKCHQQGHILSVVAESLQVGPPVRAIGLSLGTNLYDDAGWLERQEGMTSNHIMVLMQAEVERFHAGMLLLHDYHHCRTQGLAGDDTPALVSDLRYFFLRVSAVRHSFLCTVTHLLKFSLVIELDLTIKSRAERSTVLAHPRQLWYEIDSGMS